MLEFLKSQMVGYDNLFIGEVRIKDYGDKANQELAERFHVNQEKHNLPETILFTTKDGGDIREVVRRPPGRFEAIPDDMTAQEILEHARYDIPN